MKVLSKREFDSRYQNMKDYPTDTLYEFYRDLMEEVAKGLEELYGMSIDSRIKEEDASS